MKSSAAAAGAPHKNQPMTTMTRSAEELTREEHIDLRVLVEYIKVDLFPKAKFVLGKDEWDVGGIIYKDYVKCCQGRMGLQTMTELERERYMETVWMRALNKKVQKKALVQKRSAIYTVMQNKFTGNLLSDVMGWVQDEQILILTCCCSCSVGRHVSTLCEPQVCFAFDGESQEKVGGPQGPLHFLHVFLHGCRRRRALEGMSVNGR